MVAGIVFVGFQKPKIQAIDTGMVIENYRVSIVVKKDGRYEIVEELSVNFLERRRGIFLNIPTRYSMTWSVEGKEYYRKYYFPVSDIKVDNKYSIQNFTEGVQIRIGDPDIYVIDIVDYRISYTIQSRDLKLDGRQMFYYNVIGSQWQTDINKVEFDIKFESAIDAQAFWVYSGAYGASNQMSSNFTCNFFSSENRHHCVSKEKLSPMEGVTVQQNLPNDYFKFPDYSYLYIIASGISIAYLLFVVFIYYSKGKDGKVVKTIEFTAPKGINASAVGYIIDNKTDNRDIIAQILEWAKDGYLIIDDTESKSLKFIKQRELYEGTVYEKNLFSALFLKGNEVTDKQLAGNFYTAIEKAKISIVEHFKKEPAVLYEPSSKAFKSLLTSFVWLPITAMMIVIPKVNNYEYDVNLFSIIGAGLVTVIVCGILTSIKDLWNISKAATKTMMVIGVIVAVLILLGISISVGYDEDLSLIFMFGAYVVTVISMLFIGKMGRRTTFGLRTYGQCLGLFDFIKTAEVERLKLLLAENPRIFYDILPYAYAFNLAKVWTDAFKNLTIPEQDFYRTTGSFTPTTMMNRMNNSMTKVQASSFNPPPPKSGTGGGSFGSGGSFGGGGGFSGGGFGGSSGGSW